MICCEGGKNLFCYNCKKPFYLKRGFLELFDTKNYYICDRCKNDYPIHMKLQRIPLENYELVILSLFSNLYHLDLNSYCLELSKIVERMIFLHRDYFFFYVDEIRLTDGAIETFSFLADSENKNVLLVTAILKN